MILIADSGLLIALLDRLDTHHLWARSVIESETPPFLTCEAVCAEVAAVLGTAEPVLKMLDRGDLRIAFDLEKEVGVIISLVQRYRDCPMDLADACLVRMAELYPGCKVFTVDRKDFSIYRRNRRNPIPCIFPSQH